MPHVQSPASIRPHVDDLAACFPPWQHVGMVSKGTRKNNGPATISAAGHSLVGFLWAGLLRWMVTSAATIQVLFHPSLSFFVLGRLWTPTFFRYLLRCPR